MPHLTITLGCFACAKAVIVISHIFRLLPSFLATAIAAPRFSARLTFFDGARRRAHRLAGLPADPECRRLGRAGRHARAEPRADGQRMVVLRVVAVARRAEISRTADIGERFIVAVE